MLHTNHGTVSRRYIVWQTLEAEAINGKVAWSGDLQKRLMDTLDTDATTIATILYELEKNKFISRERRSDGRLVKAIGLINPPPAAPRARTTPFKAPTLNDSDNKPKSSTNGELYGEVTEVTPEMAMEWLESNTHNRTLRQQFVERLAQAIKRGEWVLNGETIKINPNAVVDGQHRLWAIVTAGLPVKALVAYNVPDAAQETIDTGVKRTLSDMLKLRGEKHHVTLAATLVQLHIWQTRGKLGLQGAFYPTAQQAMGLLEKYPEIRNSIEVARRTSAHIKYPGGLGGVLHWIFSQIDAADADDFFDRLASGHNLDEGNAILALRNTIINYGTIRNDDKIRIAALTIKAWNFYRAGSDIKTLVWKAGGAKPEPFPKPV